MATELAKAYVQIIPSAQGITGKLTEVLGGEADRAGTSAGTSFAGRFKKVIAAAGIGIALKKLISDTFAEGGELQQNLGGTEAVFGQFAENIQNKAVEAYKNMGMSASEYMATANKMGSLFQGSGIEQQKALDMTSAAMQRAADVASVMGIDMDMAMESIAGAAKGNFTMMDNLGVAMNATTLEAYALEKGINFKWNTASNAEKAELAMQMFMERTTQYAGNFARESEETWTGSIGAMKASYQNLLGDIMLGNDLSSSLQALAQTVSTFVTENLFPALINIASGLPQAIFTLTSTLVPQLISQLWTAIITSAPQIYEAANALIGQLKTGIEMQLPLILAEGVNAITNFVMGILQNIPALLTGAGELIAQFIDAISMALPVILQQGAQLLLNLVNGIIQNLPQIIVAAVALIAKIRATIGQNLPQILQSGIEIIGKLAAGLIRAIPTLLSKIPQIISSVVNAFSGTDWGSIGRNIISGIAQGLKNAGKQLWEAVKGILGDFKDKVLEFFGIHSPSRWGEYVGKMISLGFPRGVEGNLKPFKDALQKMGTIAESPFEEIQYSIKRVQPANGETPESALVERVDRLIELMILLLRKKDGDIRISIRDREAIRILRELGVSFG